jgi:hypothetical protein
MKIAYALTATLALALAAPQLPALAQTVYKCTADGKVTYSQTPCPAGAASAGVLAVPEAPAADTAAGADLARQKKQAAALEKERLKREAREDREADRNAQAANVRAKKCAKLRLNKKWADEEVKGATIPNEERARIKAKRAAETLALECS